MKACILLFLGSVWVLLSAVTFADEPETDPITGMIIDDHWETVRNNCIACHSPKQFLLQRGTKRSWLGIIRWMQKEQGLWQFDPKVEESIVSYLAKNYAPEAASRRTPIPADLLPPNPYVSALKAEFEKKRAAGQIPKEPSASSVDADTK